MPKSNKERITLSAADWERAALELIAEEGFRALAIEPLARRMGITKGSFYWHFDNGNSFIERALHRWEEHDERNLGTALSELDGPRDRLCSLFRSLPQQKLTHHVFSELCAAAGHPLVAPVLERVANRRMKQLAGAFEEIGMSPGCRFQSGSTDVFCLSWFSSITPSESDTTPFQRRNVGLHGTCN